ncbi:MAG: hypothetical protein PWR31_1365 [Bacillota bacterium]|nr:hypothetical protein [Bacillota bacterium]
MLTNKSVPWQATACRHGDGPALGRRRFREGAERIGQGYRERLPRLPLDRRGDGCCGLVCGVFRRRPVDDGRRREGRRRKEFPQGKRGIRVRPLAERVRGLAVRPEKIGPPGGRKKMV